MNTFKGALEGKASYFRQRILFSEKIRANYGKLHAFSGKGEQHRNVQHCCPQGNASAALSTRDPCPLHSSPALVVLPCKLPPQNSTQLLLQPPNTRPGILSGPPLVVPPHSPPPLHKIHPFVLPSLTLPSPSCFPPQRVSTLSQSDLPREDPSTEH